MTAISFDEHLRIKAGKDQISCDLAGEAAILHLTTGTYFGLDQIGARIWSLLQQPRTMGEIRDVILDEYEVEAPRCEADLAALLSEMEAAGLVSVENAP